MKVIGTAGHIDHGKSTLVYRLTGIDPDHLSEEKRRGMTIDLGFAWLTLPSGMEASVVDVPGHERFVRNMLAGAAGVDVALLVIAADEGVMPQTREHLDILDLLGVQEGVVALTKSDLAEPEWLELVREEVEELLAGTSLASSPIVPVSSTTGEGVPALLAALDEALAAGPTPRDRGRPFVPVDRVFTIAGFGTVVTGTLHDGSLAEGAEVVLMPRRERSRIRTLQSHRSRVASAGPGARVAMNLQGLSTERVQRGDVVATDGAVAPTRRLDASIRVLPTSSVALRHGMSVAVHIGSAERSATVAVLGASEIEPGSVGWVQLRFDDAVASTRDQRLVIRLPSPARTIAGGVVADVSPRHRRSDPRAIERLTNLLSPRPEVAVMAASQGDRPYSAEEIAFRAGLALAESTACLHQLMDSGKAIPVAQRYLTPARWTRLTQSAQEALREYHTRFPLRRGMSKEELRSQVGWRFTDWSEVVHAMVDAGVVRENGPSVALPGHGGGTSSRRSDADAVLEKLKADPYAPPSGSVLIAGTAADESLLSAMVAENEIVRVDAGLYFERGAYDEMVRRIVESIARDGAVTVASVRDTFGTSRKYALSLLEHLDDEHITRRNGDARTLGSKAPSLA
jgi:selenocysteine-specific elongation factor